MTFGRDLSRRERQIMEIIHSAGRATASEVLEALPDPPGYSATRAMLRILEGKGHLRHARQGARYLYEPTQPPDTVARSALSHVVATFFGGSVEKAVATLVSEADLGLSDEELARIAALIERAREREEAP